MLNTVSSDNTKFDLALGFVLKHEGGFVNHKADPGGATKYGLSLREIERRASGSRAWLKIFDKDGDGDIDINDVRLFTIKDASTFYDAVWRERRLDEIGHPLIAAKVFDLLVLCGYGRTSRIVQKSLNRCGQKTAVDGVMGSKTIAALNQTYPENLMPELCIQAARFFRSLNRSEFEAGWLTRAYDKPSMEVAYV